TPPGRQSNSTNLNHTSHTTHTHPLPTTDPDIPVVSLVHHPVPPPYFSTFLNSVRKSHHDQTTGWTLAHAGTLATAGNQLFPLVPQELPPGRPPEGPVRGQ